MARNILAMQNVHGVYLTASSAPTADILKAARRAISPGRRAYTTIGLYTPEGELLDVAVMDGEQYKRLPREEWATTKMRDMRAEPEAWRMLTQHVVLMEGI